MRSKALVLCAALAASWTASADIIQSSNRVDWIPGVTIGVDGGIPTGQVAFTSVTNAPYNADPTGATDSSSAFADALLACPSGQAVTVPVGTYLWSHDVRIPGGRILRGAGRDSVTIVQIGKLYNGASAPVAFTVQDWPSGYAKGSSNLTLSSVSGISPGIMFLVDQLNDPNLVNPYGSEGFSGGSGRFGTSIAGNSSRAAPWICRVTGVAGNVVTIWPPTPWPAYASLSPQAFYGFNDHEGTGVEGITFDQTNCAQDFGVDFIFIQNSWIKDCRFIRPKRAAVHLQWARACEIRNNIFQESRAAASTSYGVETEDCSSPWLENNAFTNVTSPMMFGYATLGGARTYNYFTNNVVSVPPWLYAGLATHAVHVGWNLEEGNVGGQFYADDIHGSGSHGTLYRNRLLGTSANKSKDLYPVGLEAWQRYFQIVGNVLGTTGTQVTYDDSVVSPAPVEWTSIFYLGYSNTQRSLPNGDPLVVSTLNRCGNWNSAQAALDSACSEALAASLVYNALPSWWTNWGTPSGWPPVNPATPTLSVTLPAQLMLGGPVVNGPPPPPTNLTPVAGATGVSLSPTLTLSAYTDTNSPPLGQIGAQFQVWNGPFLVWGSGVLGAVQSVTVSSPLAEATPYTWQGRYENSDGLWSDYSSATLFTTLTNLAPSQGSVFFHNAIIYNAVITK